MDQKNQKQAPRQLLDPKCKYNIKKEILEQINNDILDTNLKNIKPQQHGYNVYVKVLSAENTEVKFVKNGKEQTQVVVTGTVEDSTGRINFRIQGDRNVGKLKPQKTICIRNGLSIVFQEYQRLELDKFGKITDITEEGNIESQYTSCNPPLSESEQKEFRNFSDIKYIAKFVPKNQNNDQRQNTRFGGRQGGRRNFGNNRPNRNDNNQQNYRSGNNNNYQNNNNFNDDFNNNRRQNRGFRDNQNRYGGFQQRNNQNNEIFN